MSFSSDCKEELCRVSCDKSCCRMAELTALYLCLGSFSMLGKGKLSVRFSVESPAIARRIFRFVQAEAQIAAQLQYVTHARFGGKREYVLTIGPNEAPALLERFGMMTGGAAPMLLSTIPNVRLNRMCCRHAFLRGAILGCGTLVNPEHAYHLEFLVKDKRLQQSIIKCLRNLNVPVKQLPRKNATGLYVKQSEHIITILTATGAHQAVTTLESTLVKRQVLGNVNRAINCDYANLQKQMNAGATQLRMIEALLGSDTFASLPLGLQEIAKARAQAPDLSLTELGQRMNPPISKSGVNNRMRRLMQIARETLNESNEYNEEG